MKRQQAEFYRKMHDLREEWGLREYSRKDLLPEVVRLLKEHAASEDDAWNDVAKGILDHVEAAEDKRAGSDLFSYDAHVALGSTKRIRRGRMNLDQLMRRKRVIDNNKRSQDIAWADETNWIWDRHTKLEGRSSDTLVEDIMTEDGSPVAPAHAPEPVK
jgi:hypothetical protein